MQDAFLTIHNEDNRSPLLDLCRKYALYHDQKAGEEAAKYLKTHRFDTNQSALGCFQLILETNQSALSVSQDTIIAQLAGTSPQVRQYVAQELLASTTEFFDNVYERGDEAANCLRSVVLDQSLWPNESSRLHVEDELFQLFLAKLMETGHDHDGRALKGIALLLMADTQRLHAFIDEDGFEALLTSLDYRLPADVRGQATLVISKFLEVSEQTGQNYFSNYITSHVEKQKADDLILAFSAAANVFPLSPTISAQLFMTEGFLVSIIPLLERHFNMAVHDTFLALLNAACIDMACRNAIMLHCGPWLSHKVSNGKGKQPSMAATILAKLRTSGAKAGDQRANKADDDVSELVDLFTHTLAIEQGRNVSDSIEGLAYTSLKPEVKEKLSKDKAFLKQLLQALETNTNIPEIVVGGLSIVSNLTHFQPNMSEEQKKISQLKAYANASRPGEVSVLEDEAHVKARCTALVDAGIMSTLLKFNKTPSRATVQLADNILLSLSRNPKDRGKLAQQGAVKLLILHAEKPTNTPTSATPNNPPPSISASHALARLLISLNPSHIFTPSSTPSITTAIPPLLTLLTPATSTPTHPFTSTSDTTRDLLPPFESLLALTNLASHPHPSAANTIIRLAFSTLDDLLLSSNIMIRRAAVELTCNLCAFEAGAGKFADGSAAAKRRLRVIVALCDVDDLATRRAAAGAVAMLCEEVVVREELLKLERGVENVLGLCEEEDGGCVVRGLCVVRLLVEGDGGEEVVRIGREKVRGEGGVERLKEVLRRRREPEVLEIGVEVFKALMEGR